MADSSGLRPSVPLMGVEEEHFLVDPLTREVVPYAGDVVRKAAEDLGDLVSGELGRYQVETKTPPCASFGELHGELRRLRTAVEAAAVAVGARTAAVGAVPLGTPIPMPVSDEPRCVEQLRDYRGLVDEHVICAAHVHVGVPDRERAVLVSNHLRRWLPHLIALSANSPFFCGRDTGYAGWRRMMWQRWPVSGPPPHLSSYDAYERLLTALVDSGTLPDRRTLFWDIRLSSRYPTIEVRAADVPVTAEESALLAALVRALTVTALRAVERGDTGPGLSAELLRAACWRAARDGLRGEAMDPCTGRLSPADGLLPSLLRHIGPALEEAGDRETVVALLHRLTATGTGADRQRAVHARRGSLHDVVDALVARSPTVGLR
ncbi:carboxylate-amine ligase [Streptomyces sp. JV184]|uniref:carboxylate-amine ligase n=1 Tax=Streptomyces sp. JV184 TaxID=858637 RepID=UPI002E75EB58|nr:glutamate--cysteine ligase [Streptomyces sp. JV184]MEE1746532.1 glutamate--cysteine ligase [Streptomyces sp. JV184]